MATTTSTGCAGRCTCGAVCYRLAGAPLFVHCCHCRWCQRETGSAFALNALIETVKVELLRGEPETVATPSESGLGQRIVRCPRCRVALWSHYPGAGPKIAFVRVGTLEEADRFPPDVHIFVASRQPWVRLSADIPAMPAYYDRSSLWPAASLARWSRARAAG